MPRYDAQRIESKWQQVWEDRSTFVTPNSPPAGSKGKLYVLDMFPYPSGEGLHVGHPEGYTATDITCRYARMQGRHVLHPMGWDAFGLPAEQHAIKTGTHPRVTTHKNIETFKRQLKSLGFSYDWSREISTTDEDYYRWTQWIFLQLYGTWFDPDYEWTGPDGKLRHGKGRPIAELPIPEHLSHDRDATRRYQDSFRLAYQSEAAVNWCPALGTVLANEEVLADGTSEVGGHPVERRPLRQWMLRITAYAERLLGELDDVDWPESIKLLQRNWIGKSVGAEVDFRIDTSSSSPGAPPPDDSPAGFEGWKTARTASGFPASPEPEVLRVYTTRPDTLYGATYMVVAPEHPIVDRITTPSQRGAVAAYRQKASLKSDLDRTDLAKEKTGVFTGAYAFNPVNGQRIPIWIADYVLISYGTGAIMAVPAHDERDFEFARQFELPIITVVAPGSDSAPVSDPPETVFDAHGFAVNSGDYNGTSTADFKQRITTDLATAGLGREAVNYRLRDWLFSRQRYWGEPFPIWHEVDSDGNLTGLIRTVDEGELPVTLPEMEDFKPKGTPEPPLSWAPESWLYATAADGTRLKRETNSMPQWAGSCWYYLRFCDNKNQDRFIDPELEKYWLPVDLYIGGAEHAVLHLLYSRFWHKVLFDCGHVSHSEPFRRLVNQGMILGDTEYRAYKEIATGNWCSAEQAESAPEGSLTTERLTEADVVKKGDTFVLVADPSIRIEARAFKMSKSRGNVINPDDIVQDYGADSLRLYEMFMGPLEQTKPWSMSGVEGIYRFLSRVWRMYVDERSDAITLDPSVQDVPPTDEQWRVLHKTIKAVTEDIEKLSFNTAISRMMEFTNAFTGEAVRPRACLEPFVLLLAPYAPHLAEEIWELLGHSESLTNANWPQWDAAKLVEAEVEIPVQVNGKLRAKVRVPADGTPDTLQAIAEADPTVQTHLAGKTIVKVVAVPGRMVNFVVR